MIGGTATGGGSSLAGGALGRWGGVGKSCPEVMSGLGGGAARRDGSPALGPTSTGMLRGGAPISVGESGGGGGVTARASFGLLSASRSTANRTPQREQRAS